MKVKGLLKKLIHPNRISAFGALSTGAGVSLLSDSSTDFYGAGLIGLGYFCDYIDGKIARNLDLKTVEGAKLDPLLDKAKNLFVGGYILAKELARGGIVLPVSIASNFVVDYVSQKDRGDLGEQVKDSVNAVWDIESCHKDEILKSDIRANVYGKCKTAIQVGANLGFILASLYNSHLEDKINIESFSYFLAGSLAVSAGLGVKGILERRKNRKL